jgi:hypothetical protein
MRFSVAEHPSNLSDHFNRDTKIKISEITTIGSANDPSVNSTPPDMRAGNPRSVRPPRTVSPLKYLAADEQPVEQPLHEPPHWLAISGQPSQNPIPQSHSPQNPPQPEIQLPHELVQEPQQESVQLLIQSAGLQQD